MVKTARRSGAEVYESMTELRRKYDRRCKPETSLRKRWRDYYYARKRTIVPVIEGYISGPEYSAMKLQEKLAAYRAK
jgi:hypothetical protein